MADDVNTSVSAPETSLQAADASRLEDNSLQDKAKLSSDSDEMILLNEFVSQIKDDSSPLAFRGYNRNDDTDFVSDLYIVDTETNTVVDSIDLVEHMALYDDPKGISCEYYKLFFVDINFDGYKDLEIVAGLGTWNTYRIYFIWDSNTNSFIEDPYNISALGLPSFDEEKQLIYSMDRGSAADHWYYTHKYIDGVLTVIEEISDNAIWNYNLNDSRIEKIQETIPLFANGGTLTHWVKKQLDTDTMEMVVVEEKYVLYNNKDGNMLEEYDVNSAIGMKISEILRT